MLSNGEAWDVSLLKDTFTDASVEAILNINLRTRRQQYRLAWIPDTKGLFSIKSIYFSGFNFSTSTTNSSSVSIWKTMWKAKLHTRHKLFLWKILSSALPTKDLVRTCFALNDVQCSLCGSPLESLEHLFLDCAITRIIWRPSRWPLDPSSFRGRSISFWVSDILNPGPALRIPQKEAFAFTIFCRGGHVSNLDSSKQGPV